MKRTGSSAAASSAGQSVADTGRAWRAILGALLLLGLFALPVQADDGDPPADPPPEAAPDATPDAAPEAAPDEGPDEAPVEDGDGSEDGDTPEVVRTEIHKLYVPYRELQRIFEKEGDGVFLPYAEFRALWDKAHRVAPDRTKPPVPFALRAATYDGEADGERLHLKGMLEIEVLQSGWQRVPLRFDGLGIETATLDGQPALLVPQKHGYDLMLKGTGTHRLEVVLRGVAPAEGEAHRIAIGLPPVPLARLVLAVAGTDAEITLKPQLAASSRPGADGRTTLTAWLGPVERLELGWRRKPEEGPQETPLVFADEEVFVAVDRGVVRTTTSVGLSVHRAPIARVRLAVPAEAIVLFVQGERLRGWTRSDDGTQIEVELREATRDPVALRIGLERAVAAPPIDVTLPWVAVDEVERERGFLRVEAAEGVRVEPLATAGLVQIDAKDLPAALAAGAAPGRTLAWRFPARPAPARLAVTALAPRVVATIGHRLALGTDGLEGRTRIQLEVDRAGVFGIDLPLAPGLDVTEVVLDGVALDDWTVREGADGSRRLVIAFRDRLLGTAAVNVNLRQAFDVPEEIGRPLNVALPLLVPSGIEHARGYVAIHADPALDRRVVAKDGLTVLDDGVAGAVEPPGFVGERARLPLVHRFEHRDGALALTLELVRKAPTVTCSVESSVRLEPDRTRLSVQLHYHVAFRGVDTFRFSGPLAWGERVHLEQAGMQLLGPESEPRPADAPEAWTAKRGIWTVKLVSPRTGAVLVPLVLDDQPETALGSGASRETEVPRFVPLEVEGKPLPNVVHHVAVRRDPLLEAAMRVVDGGEEIDARELPAGLQGEESFLALRSYAPEHRFVVGVTRHDYEPVAEVVVSHMHLETVVPAEGRGITEAFLIVRSNDRQYLRLKLPGKATVRAVRVGGQIEAPRVDPQDADTILIPLLTGLRKDEAFEVALVYEHDVERDGSVFRRVRARSPEPIDVDADLLTWHVYLPDDDPVSAFGGSVTPAKAPTSWAARRLAGWGEGLVHRPEGRPTPFARLVDGFESPFSTVKPAVRHAFQGRIGIGDVTITRVAPTALVLFKIAATLLAFLLVLLGGRAARRAGHGAAPWVTGAALLLFLLLVPAGPGMAGILTSALLGVGLAAAALLLAWRIARAARPTPEETPLAPPPAAAAEGGAA